MTIRFIFLFLITTTLLTAQSPYELKWKQESTYLGLGLAMTGFDLYQNAKVIQPLTLEEIAGLDRSDVNSFDRGATFNSSQRAKIGSDILQNISYTAPFLFLTAKEPRKEWGKILLIYFETALIVRSFTGTTKDLTKRIRPLTYNDDFSMAERQKKQNRFSFFSGHVSTTASNCFFGAKVFSDYFPDSKWKPYVWGVAATIPAFTGYFRVKAGKHYRTDVMTGYLVGGALGILIPHFHKKDRKNKMSIIPTSNGFLLTKVF